MIYFCNVFVELQISTLGFEFNLMEADSESNESIESEKEQAVSVSPQVS